MNPKSITITVAVAALMLMVGTMVSSTSATQQTPQTAVTLNRTASVQYAQLLISGDQQQQYLFDTSGGNNLPRVYDLAGLYRNLGGNERPTFVNLLGQIGGQGWKLVDVSPDRTEYLFQR